LRSGRKALRLRKKPPPMLSIPDVAILGGLALLLFGPERLPKIARDAGRVMRDLQNTSQAFMREIERAADVEEDDARAEEFRQAEAEAQAFTAGAEVQEGEPPAIEAAESPAEEPQARTPEHGDEEPTPTQKPVS